MAWTSRSALGLFKLCSRTSQLNKYRLTAISSSIVTNNNGCQQVRFNSVDARLSAFNDIVTNQVIPAVNQVPVFFGGDAPVLAAQELLCQLHDITGIGWMSTIILTTVGLRFVIGLPISVVINRSAAKLENLTPDMKQLVDELRREAGIGKNLYSWSEKHTKNVYMKAYKEHSRRLYAEHNCHPRRPLALAFLQIPAWVIFTSAVRNLTFMMPPATSTEMLAEQQYRYMQLFVENSSWMDSLITPDPVVLPAIFVLSGLLNVQINALTSPVTDGPMSKLRKGVQWFLRCVIVGVGAYATVFPAAVTLFWATSSVCALFVNILLKIQSVRRLLRIPITPSTVSLLPNFRNLFRFSRATPVPPP